MTLREQLRMEREPDSPCAINWPDGHERHELMIKGARIALEAALEECPWNEDGRHQAGCHVHCARIRDLLSELEGRP